MEGYAGLCRGRYYESRMLKAFKNISTVLSKREMDELGWKAFPRNGPLNIVSQETELVDEKWGPSRGFPWNGGVCWLLQRNITNPEC